MNAIRAQRLTNQQLTKPEHSPAELVAAFGAMQAQEYAMAKWAIGLRTPGTTDAEIEQAIHDGRILRTHPLRLTHHFVAPADIRWLLALLAPRAIARAEPRWRELGLDGKTFAKSQAVLARALAGGKHLVRTEVGALLRESGIAPDGQRLAHLIGRAELDGVICSGARRGKQITIALLDERAPESRTLAREESLAELARRYFTTRAPATIRDFIWWSGLAAADAREAIALNDARLVTEVYQGTTYWLAHSAKHLGGEPPQPPLFFATPRSASLRSVLAKPRISKRAYLLPTYDEYTVAYRDRRAIGTPPSNARNFGESTLLGPGIVLSGEVVGSWSRTIGKKGVKIELRPWRKLSLAARAAVDRAANRYAAFLGQRRG